MENPNFDNGEKVIGQEGLNNSEQAFMKGYAEDQEVEECAECGGAINDEKKIVREIEGEKYAFCSELCAEEFAESL